MSAMRDYLAEQNERIERNRKLVDEELESLINENVMQEYKHWKSLLDEAEHDIVLARQGLNDTIKTREHSPTRAEVRQKEEAVQRCRDYVAERERYRDDLLDKIEGIENYVKYMKRKLWEDRKLGFEKQMHQTTEKGNAEIKRKQEELKHFGDGVKKQVAYLHSKMVQYADYIPPEYEPRKVKLPE